MTVRIRRASGAPIVLGDTTDEPLFAAAAPASGGASAPRSKAPRRSAAAKKTKTATGKKSASPQCARKKSAQKGKPGRAGSSKSSPRAKKQGTRPGGGKRTGKTSKAGKAGKAGSTTSRKSTRKKSSEKPAKPSAPGQGTLAFDESPVPAPKPAETPKSNRNSKASRAASGRRATAESMAGRQREISVSEFFTKNRHLLGFDSPARALLTTVKEAVDNSLDACEEAGILPALRVELHEVSDTRYRVVVQDNGPGIVRSQVPKVFGKLLYGSKFHRLRQSRGQQGIGISAAGMYGQLTTGKPVVITSKTGKGRQAHHFEIVIDTTKNVPVIVEDHTVPWDVDHGTRVEIELEGTYKGGRRSVDEYLEQVAIANPHAEIRYQPPKGRAPLHLERAASVLPAEPVEIKPHPYGVELGTLQQILKETKARTLSAALQQEFSRVSAKVAERIITGAGLETRRRAKSLKPGELERLHKTIPTVKIFAPPTTCVVPIGEDLVRRGLEREIQADFYTSSTRPPAVYRGNPFQVEVGLAYGGDLRRKMDEDGSPHTSGREVDAQQGPITLLRLANRVPLQYQQSACATFKAVVDTNWRQYGLSQPKGSLPQGPMVLLVHIASVWVPFTSESKEAVAHYDEILSEMRRALQDCGRKLGGYLRKREHHRREERRRSIFEMYIGEIVESLGKLTRVDRKKLQKQLSALAAQHTGNGAEEAEAYVAPIRRARSRPDEEEDA